MIFYSFYSFWVLFLLILQLLNIIKFSCIPSAILVSIGTLIIEIIRYYKKILTLKRFIIDFLIHIPPFILVSLNFSMKDVYMNLIIMVLYYIYLYINNISIPYILKAAVMSDVPTL
jgi:hypothetical protein